jgi:hypothetical protein
VGTRLGAPGADDDRAAVGVEAEHPHLLRAEKPADLFGYRAEYVRLCSLPRHERGDALKRSLFAWLWRRSVTSRPTA